MRNGTRSHLIAGLTGGAVVGATLLAFGVTGKATTQTVIEPAPVPAEPTAGTSRNLTPQGIYQRESGGVVHVTARVASSEPSVFDVLHQAATGTMTGSGFVADRRGDVLTSYHLIEGASSVTIGFSGGLERAAHVVSEDPGADVAVLRVNPRDLPPVEPLPLGRSTSVRIGDPTLAIGNPSGVDRTLSAGILSSLPHQLEAAGGHSMDNVIQTDAPVDPTAAGGPLLNAAGEVIGIASQLTGPAGTTIGFATPIDTALPLLNQARRGHPVSMPYIGLTGVTTRRTHPPVTVTAVRPGGPAARAGLRRGDSIYRLGAAPVSSTTELGALVATHSPGQWVRIEIGHRGRVHTIRVQLGTRR